MSDPAAPDPSSSSPGAGSPGASASRPAPRPRRWLKLLILLVALGLAVAAAGPWLAAPIVSSLLVGGLEDQLDASVQVQGLDLRHGAGLHLTGLQLFELDPPELGQPAGGAADRALPLASIGMLDAQVDLLGLLSNRLTVDVTLEGFELHLRQDADGRINLERVLKTKPDDDDDEEDSHKDRSSSTSVADLPHVVAHIDVRGGRVVVHHHAGTTELRDIALRLDVDGLDAPATWSLSAALAGPSGAGGAMQPGGRLELSGDVRLDEFLEPRHASLHWKLEGWVLASLSPALEALANIAVQSGTLNGEGHYDIEPQALRLSGESSLSLTGLAISGPALGEAPLLVPDLLLAASGDMGASGTDGHTLQVTLGDAATLKGSFGPLSATEGGRAALTIDAQLDRLTELLRPFVPLAPGQALGGALLAQVEVELTGAATAPSGLDLGGQLVLRDLVVHDEGGVVLPLGELTGLTAGADLGLSWDDAGSGTLLLRNLTLDAGPVQVSGSGSLGGLPNAEGLSEDGLDVAALRPGATRFVLNADLDRLGAALAPLLADEAGQPTWTLAGSVAAELESAAAVAGGDGLPPEALLSLRIENLLAADGAGLRAQIGSLVSEQRWTADAALPGLQGSLALAGLRVTDAEGLELELGTLDAQDRLSLDGDLAGVVTSARLAGLRIALPDMPEVLELASVSADLGLQLDTVGGGLELQSLAVELPGATLGGSGRVAFDPRTWSLSGAPGGTALDLDWRLQWDEVAPLLAQIVEGLELSGAPLSGQLALTREAAGWHAVGNAAGRKLKLTQPLQLVQKDLTLAFDVVGDPEHEIRITQLSFGSKTAHGALSGTFGIADPEATQLDFALDGELPVILKDLSSLLALPIQEPRGTLAVRQQLSMQAGRYVLTGGSTIDDFGVTLPSSPPGDPDLVLSDPQLQVKFDLDVGLGEAAGEATTVTLRRVGIDSSLLTGDLAGGLVLSGDVIEAQGLTGEFRYVPERLGALLGPLLPVSWRGAEEQSVVFAFDGRLDPADLGGSLQAGRLALDGGTGRLVTPYGELLGRFDVKLEDGRGVLLTTLDIQPAGQATPVQTPGQVTLQLDLDVRDVADAVTRLRLDIGALDARAESAQMLANLHPLFSAAAGEGGLVRAMVDGHIELSYSAPLLPTLLEAFAEGGAGLEALSLAPLSGSGELAVSKALIKASPLSSEILGKLGLPVTEEASLDPLVFKLDNSRVKYARPWKWNLAGHATEWSGSVGLDKSLDLAWSLPITKELIDKYDKLESLEGELLTLKVSGQLENPTLHWNEVLGGLVQRALKKKVTGPLDVLLGKGDADPAVLLSQADTLWKAGKREEARPIYKQLATTYKLTLVYVLNKKRIKKRADDDD